MSSPPEPVSQAGNAPPPAGKPQPKLFGLPRPVAIVAIAGAVALGLVWWRSRHSAQAAAGTQTSATTATAQTVGLQDQLAQLQDEIGALQAQGIGAGSAGGTGTTGTTGTSATTAPPTTAATTTPTTPATADKPAPTSLTFTPTATGARAAWKAAATGTAVWHLQVETAQGGDLVFNSGTIETTSATIGGLKSKTAYRGRVSSLQPRGLWTGWVPFTTT